MEYFKHLPEEITLDILIRVPAESVLECKLVCRNWRSLIRRPSFSKMHFKHHLNHAGELGFIALTSSVYGENYQFQYFEYSEHHESTTQIDRIRRLNFNLPFEENTRFHGSCNGLICLTQSQYIYLERGIEDKTYVYSPVTREYIMLPQINKTVRMDYGGSGFGYVSSTDEYKVVKVMLEPRFAEVYIYTLGSGLGWRNLGKFNVGTTEHWEEDAIFVNGTLYWLYSEIEMIIPFDLAEEKFCEHLSPPPSNIDMQDDCSKLVFLGGCLSYTIIRTVNGATCWDVWLLKRKDDSHDIKGGEGHQALGWSKVFRVYDEDFFAVTKSHAVLTYNGNHINIHDLKASTSKKIVDFNENVDGVIPHKNTLLSLEELGEEDIMIMESDEFAKTENHHQPFNQQQED